MDPPRGRSTPEKIARPRGWPPLKAPSTLPTSMAIKLSQCENRYRKTDTAYMVASTETRKFAAEHAQKSLGQLAFDINRVTKSRDAESVLGLRLSLRRFSQTLQLF